MPINLPNGGNVDEIILPNGASASEVYGPNGNLVWQDVAIPDSGDLQSHHVVSNLGLNDNDSISTFSDESGNNNDMDAIGSPTFQEDGINGQAVADFDGVDDGAEHISEIDLANQNSVFFSVLDPVDTNDNAQIIDYEDPDGVFLRYEWSDNQFRLNAGDGAETGGSQQEGSQIIIIETTDATRLFINGSHQITANGTIGYESGSLAIRGDGADSNESVWAEWGWYIGAPDGRREDVEQYLSDKYDIELA